MADADNIRAALTLMMVTPLLEVQKTDILSIRITIYKSKGIHNKSPTLFVYLLIFKVINFIYFIFVIFVFSDAR